MALSLRLASLVKNLNLDIRSRQDIFDKGLLTGSHRCASIKEKRYFGTVSLLAVCALSVARAECLFLCAPIACRSGVIADVVTHPISTLKTRLQVQGAGSGTPGSSAAIARYHSIAHAAHSVVRNEGVATLYKGLGITVLAAAPAQGLYFAGYDLFRAWAPRDDPLSNFAAGCFAQLCGSLVRDLYLLETCSEIL